MANLMLQRLGCQCHFPNQFLITIPPQLQTSIIPQKRFLNTYSDSKLVLTVSCHKSSSSVSLSSFTVKYLTNSCGLSLQEALSASRKSQLDEHNSHKYESVLSLLISFQFSDTHIKKLLIKCPRILKMKVDDYLKPKLEYLKDNGFVGPLLPELIVANPPILLRSLSDCIIPAVEILRKYVQTNDKVIAAVKRSSWLLSSDLKGILQPNVEFLLSEGVTASAVENLIVWQSRTLLLKYDKLVSAVETVKKLGLKPSSSTFVQAIRTLVSMSDSTWNRKVQLFKSLGWSEEEILSAFKRDPLCLAGSEEKIRSIMDFYVNTMKLNPADIAVYPKLLMFGINTRIRPRYNVIEILESKELLKKSRKLMWAFTISEENFLKRYVNKHLEQVPNLMELYRGTSTGDNIDIQPH